MFILVIVPAYILWVLPSAQEFLSKLFSANDTRTLFSLLIIFYSMFSILAIMLLTTGMHLIQAARKTHRSGHFPAPGMRVVRDTWQVSGGRATLMTYMLTTAGILFILGGSSVPFYFHSLLLQMLLPVG